ncbi:hypothetical protein GXP71_13210 [Cellulomonas sp. H30R-01]|uniref:hypothetical protein n=1 Tax=Cellulomonas sp. H30R-01 TaxID=2704467 RepID=UPI00138B842A|nr:hypothetical protein [Cellulomonas sp. H30R-01]QHT56940.1 hypothetical protein GXP71_13210 [Cellulomonas sp. H30R-01]
MIGSLLAAIASSVGYGVSTIMQAVGARRARGLGAVLQPLVVAAFVLDGLAWLLSLAALDHLPLFVVQAVIAASLVVVVLLARVVLHATMRRLDVAAVVAVVAALVVVAAAGGEQPAVHPPDGFVGLTIAAAGVVAVATLAVYRSGPPVLLAVLGGLGYSIAAIGARAAHADGDLLDTVLQPLAIPIVVGGVAGALAYLRALERGSVGTAAAIVSVIEVVVPGVVGLTVLGDFVRDGWAVPAAAALAVALAGCVALATSPANAAAESGDAPGDDAVRTPARSG